MRRSPRTPLHLPGVRRLVCTHHDTEGLLHSHPALGLVEVVRVLTLGEFRAREWYEHTVRRGVCGIPKDVVAFRQPGEAVVEAGVCERRPIVLAPRAVHGPGNDLEVGVAYRLLV